MSKRYDLIDPQTGRRVVLVERTHKPPVVREHRKPMEVIRHRREPIYRHPEFYPYQQYTRHSKAVSWFIGVAGFFLFFVACAIHPAVTIAGWGLVTAILVYRSMKE